MSKKVKLTDSSIDDTVKRIEELQKTRTDILAFSDELKVREKDLKDAEVVYGVKSKEYEVQKGHYDDVLKKISDAESKVKELSFKKSELKPVLDALAKKFEDAYKEETSKSYDIELASAPNTGKNLVTDGKLGKKVFKQLLEYLYHNVSFTPKTAANLMVLVRNMEENRAWVNSPDFNNVIKLRSASVLSLWRFIIDDMSGKGFYEARTFLECWANCGQAVSETVRKIQDDNTVSRKIGGNLNLVEDEFDKSEDDLPKEEGKLTTQEEVNPDVSE